MSDKGLDASPNSAVLVERNGRFFIYEPRLGVIASDESVEKAYGKFIDARRGHAEEIARAGLTAGSPGLSPPAMSALAGRSTASELRLFVAKTCIVLLIVAALVGVAVMGVQQAVSGLVAAI